MSEDDNSGLIYPRAGGYNGVADAGRDFETGPA